MKFIVLIFISIALINALDCPAGLTWDPVLNVCVNVATIGWCKPSGGWLLGSCSECVKCLDDFKCAVTSDICVDDINCGDWNHTCSGATPPTPVVHNCSSNQNWNGTACVNEVGWCQPKGSWLYETCAQCVACPAVGACPDDQQCVDSMNCKDWDTYCSVTKTLLYKLLDWL